MSLKSIDKRIELKRSVPKRAKVARNKPPVFILKSFIHSFHFTRLTSNSHLTLPHSPRTHARTHTLYTHTTMSAAPAGVGDLTLTDFAEPLRPIITRVNNAVRAARNVLNSATNAPQAVRDPISAALTNIRAVILPVVRVRAPGRYEGLPAGQLSAGRA